jgi:ribose/xylose/arabinose/galactoside ABC-type transport system permease subunit
MALERLDRAARRSDPWWEALEGYSILVVVLAMFAAFSLTSEAFLTVGNAENLLKQMAVIGVLGIGMTLIVLVGGIDLSVGSVVLLSGTVTATLLTAGVSTSLGMSAGIAASMLVGAINGCLVEFLRINPVIVTLGTLIAVRGLAQLILDFNDSWIWVTDPFFERIASERLGPVPLSAAIMLVLYLVFAVLLKGTGFGRRIYAVGDNPTAAALCGVPVRAIRLTVYALCSGLAGIAGMLTAARTGVISPTVGLGLEFFAVAVVVLGGARLSGGAGRVERTLLGTAILTMVLNYLTIRGVPGTWQTTVTGFLILIAVVLDRLMRRT